MCTRQCLSIGKKKYVRIHVVHRDGELLESANVNIYLSSSIPSVLLWVQGIWRLNLIRTRLYGYYMYSELCRQKSDLKSRRAVVCRIGLRVFENALQFILTVWEGNGEHDILRLRQRGNTLWAIDKIRLASLKSV